MSIKVHLESRSVSRSDPFGPKDHVDEEIWEEWPEERSEGALKAEREAKERLRTDEVIARMLQEEERGLYCRLSGEKGEMRRDELSPEIGVELGMQENELNGWQTRFDLAMSRFVILG
ncbi:hypothetical protein MNV49_002081 [Pseudohyphozyma bogoriensis]|nr:hypothetical protein MNV49_002081 [Pseudohyphozyma bogoriensis]